MVAGIVVVGATVVEDCVDDVLGLAVSFLSLDIDFPITRPAISKTMTAAMPPTIRNVDRFDFDGGCGGAAGVANCGGICPGGGEGIDCVGGVLVRAAPHAEQKRFPGIPAAPHEVQNH